MGILNLAITVFIAVASTIAYTEHKDKKGKVLKYAPFDPERAYYKPNKAYEHDAGYDLTATSVDIDASNQQVIYGTNISFEIPKGYVGLLFPRSSVAKTFLSLTNCVGVIDAGFRGEVKFKFRSAFSVKNKSLSDLTSSLHYYSEGDRIGQLIIVKLEGSVLKRVIQLSDSQRGNRGFGSSNK